MKEPTFKQRVLDLLLTQKEVYSAEFRDKLGLLDYRTRLSELRRDGWQIESVDLIDCMGRKRPGYRLVGRGAPQSEAEQSEALIKLEVKEHGQLAFA